MKALNIVIPMAGGGTRFAEAGYKLPKPFIEVKGLPMIEAVLGNLNCEGVSFTLIARREDTRTHSAAFERLHRNFGVRIVTADGPTQGAACTVLLAKEFINNNVPLMIANSDQIVDGGIGNFVADMEKRGLDGSILTFPEPGRHPKWSYAEVNAQALVTRVKEKVGISDHATVGLYLFRQGRFFVEAAEKMITADDRVNGEFYVCPCYNYVITADRKVGIYEIPASFMHGLGTPEDLELYLKLGT